MAMAEPTTATPDSAEGAAVPMVVVDDVHVTYRVYEDRKPTLRKLVARGLQQREFREVEAVRGVSFTSYAGEVVGVIGRNGSGKSTLLRVMAGLMPATAGAVYARTEPVLLGVGAVLHPELSGRRNIYLGGLALGLSRREIDERFDEIVDFSGLAEFIDMPLRTYSSGMSARLHFAIASAVMPEILLIDEALSVGDEDFRAKSSRRIAELRAAAGTVFLVSHSLDAITEMSNRALWLNRGRIAAEGAPAEVVAAYRASLKRAT
jgi:teichoic acid transport system ATP-binding protein